ncbi:MAG TPA: peptidase [Wenzhouxiangellaceae bacterium]|nr:peptidase [Wenzhouxiangellaceae bacterium]
MTYCVATRLDQGLVFASDSRTSAGVDNVSIYSKMHRFETTPDRFLVLLSAGNLATTQAVNSQIERDLGNPEISRDINGFSHLDEVAAYVGEISARVQGTYNDQSEQNGFGASFILGGQIGDQPADIFLIYREGNYIAASRDKPFLQIGETKYGKPILDRIIEQSVSLERAGRCALVSMDASMRSNLSVGPPIELLLYTSGSLEHGTYRRFDDDDAYLSALRKAWSEGLQKLFLDLPRFDWEK